MTRVPQAQWPELFRDFRMMEREALATLSRR
jgi:hypothetical protein